jgi:hypothetical protein
MDDPRFNTGLLDMSDAARFLGIPRVTFHRWARGYARGGPLLHVLQAAPREAQVPRCGSLGECPDLPHMARVGRPGSGRRTRDVRSCHQWAPGPGDDSTPVTPRRVAGRHQATSRKTSRCVTGRVGEALAEPPARQDIASGH